MNPIQIIFFKSLIVGSFFFAIPLTLLHLYMGPSIPFLSIVCTALIIGLMNGWLQLRGQRKSLKELGINNPSRNDFRIKRSREVLSPFNLDEVITKLEKKRQFSIQKLIRTHNGIQLKTKLDDFSWGEKISIFLKGQKGENFEYLVSSKPKLWIASSDNGRNLKNLDKLEKIMTTNKDL